MNSQHLFAPSTHSELMGELQIHIFGLEYHHKNTSLVLLDQAQSPSSPAFRLPQMSMSVQTQSMEVTTTPKANLVDCFLFTVPTPSLQHCLFLSILLASCISVGQMSARHTAAVAFFQFSITQKPLCLVML